jgi:hypothetical protein
MSKSNFNLILNKEDGERLRALSIRLRFCLFDSAILHLSTSKFYNYVEQTKHECPGAFIYYKSLFG